MTLLHFNLCPLSFFSRHILEHEDPFHHQVDDTPLIPAQEDIDPFDTSIAEKLVPGRVELRVLEQELEDAVDPFFDPRNPSFSSRPKHPAELSFVSKTLEPTAAGGNGTSNSVAEQSSSAVNLRELEAELL